MIPLIATDGSIVVSKLDSRLQVTYRDPDARQAPAQGAVDGSTFTTSGAGGPLEALHITDPKPGRWTVHITAPPGATTNVVSASVLWQGAVRASVVVDPATPTPGEQIAVHVRLARRTGVVVSSAALAPLTFTATFSGDGFSPIQVPLQDTGVPPDTTRGDGEFSGWVTVPNSATGALSVLGTVSGPGVASDRRPWYGHLAAPGEVTVSIAPPSTPNVAPGGTVTASVSAANPGGPQSVRVALVDLPTGVLVTLNTAALTLPSGTSQSAVKLTYGKASRQDAPGGQLVVTDGRGTVLAAAYLLLRVQTPPGPPWALYSAGLAALVAAAVLLVLWRRRLKAAALQVRYLTAELRGPDGDVRATLPAPRSGNTFALRTDGWSLSRATTTAPDVVLIRRRPPRLLISYDGVQHEVAAGDAVPLMQGQTLVISDRTHAQPSAAPSATAQSTGRADPIREQRQIDPDL